MTKEELFQKIEDRKEELSIPYEEDPACDYLSDFNGGNRVTTLDDFLQLDIWSCMKCQYYIRSSKTFSIEQIDTMFDSLSEFFDSMNLSSLEMFLDFCEELTKNGLVENIIDVFHESGVKQQLLLRKLSKFKLSSSGFISRLKSFFQGEQEEKNEVDLLPFFQLLNEEPVVLFDLFDFYRVYVQMRQDSEDLQSGLNEMDASIRRKEKKSFIESFFQDNYSVHRLIGEVNEIFNYVRGVEKKTKKLERFRGEELAGLNKAQKLLEKGLLQDEIKNAREIVRDVKNLALKKDILQFIYDYNSKYYRELEEEYHYYNQDSLAHYQALLNDYGLLHDGVCIESIMHNSLDDVKKILELLKKIGIDFQYALYILENTNILIVLKIKEYVEKGYLSSSFLNHHIQLFDGNLDKFQTFQNNIELFKRYSLNPLLFRSSIHVLLEDTTFLQSQLDLCRKYDLLKVFRNTKDFHFLHDKDLALKLDRFIELGYESFLDQSLDCLNFDHLKRLEVLRTLFMSVDSYEELSTVLGNDKRFFISDDQLDDYIPDVLPYVSEEKVSLSFSDLNTMVESARTYRIGSVLVSSSKVERLLGEGKSLYEAIFDGLKLSKDEYDEMISILCSQSENSLLK